MRGTYAWGIHNTDSGTTLVAENTIVLAEDSDTYSLGLYNQSGATARLYGASFTARGGTYAWGIHNLNNGTTLMAESVTTLAENGITNNYGLSNYDGTVTADSSQFTGISNGLALGNFGLYLNGGTVSLGVSQLDGYAYRISGTLTCFQVYDGNYAAYTCP